MNILSHDIRNWQNCKEHLSRYLDESDYSNIDKANIFSNRQIGKINESLTKFIQGKPKDVENFGWAVTGSLAREEALVASDIDLTLLVNKDEKLKSAQNIDKEVRKVLSQTFKVKVSKGKNLTGPYTAKTVADVDKIGGLNDNVILLTKRMLLLAETQCVYNTDLYNKHEKRYMKHITGRFTQEGDI